jgi:hypothetical protein
MPNGINGIHVNGDFIGTNAKVEVNGIYENGVVNGTHENGVVNGTHESGVVNGTHENGVVNGAHENGVVNESEFSKVNGGVDCNHINEAIKTSRRLFCLSAFDEACGKRQIKNLCDYLKDRPDSESDDFLGDLAYTLGERRSVLPWKAAISACSAQELVKSLESSETKFVHSAKAPILAYCFTGQGAQWYGMGREMLQSYLVFRHSIMRSSRYLHCLGAQWNLVGINGFPNGEDYC